MNHVEQPALFDEPPREVRRPVARVVLLCGASGSGKTSLTRRLGLPVLQLDEFYREGDDPALPRRFGIVDWDDAASWDADCALRTVLRLCATGESEVPVYDIPTSRRTGTSHLDLGGAQVFVAEGIFAAHLVKPSSDAGVLADAICLQLSPRVTFWRRLLRDLAESRKPPITLIRRGVALMREEPRLISRWTALGCRPLTVAEAESSIRRLVSASRPGRGPHRSTGNKVESHVVNIDVTDDGTVRSQAPPTTTRESSTHADEDRPLPRPRPPDPAGRHGDTSGRDADGRLPRR